MVLILGSGIFVLLPGARPLGASDLIGTPALLTIRLSVDARAALDARNLALAQETAGALLATAGIRADWRLCAAPGACGTSGPDACAIPILLAPHPSADHRSSGEVVQDGRSGRPAILVYVPHVAEVTIGIRLGRVAREHPGLATVRVGHLVGLTVAHEIGHALRLAHAPSGVMKPRFDVDDVIALRTGRLTFTPDESARMRQGARPILEPCFPEP